MTPDSELLRRYAEAQSEEAFAELVSRHLGLVYSAALRQVNGDAALAQDVAQTVFADLARKATSLSRRPVLTGWLYTSTHFAVTKALRTEQRRHTREQEAHTMQQLLQESAPDADWEKLQPVLDQLMLELKDTDREAILLRYFENRPLAEVGAKIGLSENAARMRVDRALEKLRTLLSRRGITTTTTLSIVLSTNAVQTAPTGLAATLTSTSLASAAAATLGSSTVLTLFNIIAMTKLKISIIAAVIVAGFATTTWMIQRRVEARSTAPAPDLLAATPAPVVQTNFPKSSWGFAGYADPVSALVTTLWAGSQSKGDVTFASLSPELQQQLEKRFSQQLKASKISLAEFLTLSSRQRVSSITGFRVLDQQTVSDDQVVLHVFVEGKNREDSFKMKKFGTEWKMADFPPDY